MMPEERPPIWGRGIGVVGVIPSPRRRRRSSAIGCGQDITLCCRKVRRCRNACAKHHGGGQHEFQFLHRTLPQDRYLNRYCTIRLRFRKQFKGARGWIRLGFRFPPHRGRMRRRCATAGVAMHTVAEPATVRSVWVQIGFMFSQYSQGVGAKSLILLVGVAGSPDMALLRQNQPNLHCHMANYAV